MKLDQPMELIVTVKETGSNNAARIMGEGITASSTNSAEIAVLAAVKKFIQRNRIENAYSHRCIGSGLGHSQWMITISAPKGVKP